MAKDSRYESINITPEAAAALRTLTAAMTMERGKRVTISEVVLALTAVGEQNRDDLAGMIKKD